MKEHFFLCPYCWERISVLVDVSQKHQNYIEDCEVCCNPIQLIIRAENNKIISFQAQNFQ